MWLINLKSLEKKMLIEKRNNVLDGMSFHFLSTSEWIVRLWLVSVCVCVYIKRLFFFFFERTFFPTQTKKMYCDLVCKLNVEFFLTFFFIQKGNLFFSSRNSFSFIKMIFLQNKHIWLCREICLKHLSFDELDSKRGDICIRHSFTCENYSKIKKKNETTHFFL